jgi:hypothetical protein
VLNGVAAVGAAEKPSMSTATLNRHSHIVYDILPTRSCMHYPFITLQLSFLKHVLDLICMLVDASFHFCRLLRSQQRRPPALCFVVVQTLASPAATLDATSHVSFFAVKLHIRVFKNPQSIIPMAALSLGKLRLSINPSLSFAVGVCGMGVPRDCEAWVAIESQETYFTESGSARVVGTP